MSAASQPPPLLSIDENVQLREQHIAESCELHFNDNPMKIVRSKDQYLYDEMGDRYIDFVSRITNVGHCNDAVVEAACQQMAQLSMAVFGEEAKLQQSLTKQLLATLPSSFEVVLFTNSGAEANDLALQMARNYTHRHDLVVVDGAFHGTGNLLVDISPRAFKTSIEAWTLIQKSTGDGNTSVSSSYYSTIQGKKPWVHVIPVPDTFRGPYGKDDAEAGKKYFEDAKSVIERAKQNNREIAGFICEPVMVVHGVLIPPPQWLNRIYSYIHEIGGIVVADEIQCGMGRTGETFWAFQGQSAVPDIITVGKPLGNGHPIGAVITSRKIAATIKSAEHIYKCDLVGATISMTVLNVMEDRQLMENAQTLGTFLADGFRQLQRNHSILGDVRQKGLIVGVDIVSSRGSKKPAPDIAEEICNSLRKKRILVGCEGESKNVLLFLPALVLTREDCNYVMDIFSQVLKCVELSFLDDLYNILSSHASPEPSTSLGVQCTLSDSSHDSPYQRTQQHPYDALD